MFRKPKTIERLDGQVALVTGASRGIGARIASDLADLGALVYAGARNPTRVDDARLQSVKLDVTRDADAREAAARIRAEAGRLDVLVNNAGVIADEGVLLEEEPVEAMQNVLATNVLGPMMLTKRMLPLLLARPGGRVVNVSSGWGSHEEGCARGQTSYGVSKAALNALTLYLDRDYGARGLVANAVCPGWVRTQMGGEGAPRSVQKGAETPVWLARFAPGAPGGRFWRDQAIISW